MSFEVISVINKNNINDLNLIKNYEQEKNIENPINIKITDKCLLEYKDKKENEIQKVLYIKENNKIKDACLIEIKKDLKQANIEFLKLEKKYKSRKLLKITEEFLFNVLNIYDIFIEIKKDEYLENYLIKLNYEDLGITNNSHIYLKENFCIK